MSGYPSSTEGNGLDSLFAQLRQQNQPQAKPINLEPAYSYYGANNNYMSAPPQHSYQPPSVASALPTPPVPAPQPSHSSAIMSPVDPHQPRGPPPTSNLLNLLKFSQPSGSSTTQPTPIGPPPAPSREPSTSYAGSEALGQTGSSAPAARGSQDLLAALMSSKPAQHVSPQVTNTSQAPQPAFGAAASSPSADTQAYLLKLLNQPKPSQPKEPLQEKPAKVLTPPSKASTPGDEVEELTQALEDTSIDISLMGSSTTEGMASFGNESFQVSAAKANQGLFTYVNPFEQLAASSPRNQTPKSDKPAPPAPATAPSIQILKRQEQPNLSHNPNHKRKVDASSSTPSPAHSKQKFEAASQVSSGPPTPLPDRRTPVEALIGIGAPSPPIRELDHEDIHETVQEAVEEFGEQADRQAQDAIARAEKAEAHASIEKDLRDLLAAKSDKEFEERAQIAAKDIKKELEKEENSGALDSLPTPVAENVKEIIDETAHGHIADSWESADAEDSPVKEDDDSIVKVYNFPMRPWTSITLKDTEEPRPQFRDEAVMDIARLKKDFDQIDRTLVTASNNFIVYGMSKNGGVRIIRQDDGKDARLFTETHDRIFSVVTSASSADLKESVIATGISGTVYWALVKDGEGDHIEESHPETFGFALPPIHSQETESAGGVLKTRARKSSNHPDFFAVGRGKFINLIWPSAIMKQSYLKDGKERLVDVERYLSKHSLRVNTGKAGKDFAFSEDDSTIVSLDKAGRVKFWDVRSLTKTDILGTPAHSQHIEIKEPLITFTTTPATEKSWPTSVLFVDKLRPYQRGGALRYLVVGMKQNHTLQLWDLALKKPVQEINLPHTKESDAVCSVVYHAATGMIVVGHPTRNSIYFLHLSAPKYVLQKAVTQAEYIEKVAGDGLIPKPESTAVISGMREYSFANKGVLRSLDILQTPNSANASDSSTLFELYCMHSKGVTCLNIKQADLGWTSDNKVIHPVVAEKVGVITIESIKEIPTTITPEVSDPATQAPAPTRIVQRPAPKEAASKEAPKEIVRKPIQPESSNTSKGEDKNEKKDLASTNGGPATASGAEKFEKKKNPSGRRKNTTTDPSGAPGPSHVATPSKTPILDPSSMARNGTLSKAAVNTAPESAMASSAPQDFSDNSLKSVEKLFSSSLEKLLRDFKLDKKVQEATFGANQEAMLRLIGATLSDNIEVTLGRIVNKAIQTDVLPVVSDLTVKAVQEQLGPKLNSHVANHVPRELTKALPDAINKAFHQPQLLKLVSDSLTKSVAFKVEEEFHNLLQGTVLPQFTTLAIQTSQKVAADIQRHSAEQINMMERQRQADSIKIEQLTQLVTGLSETVSSMAAAQTEFQAEFLRLQQERRQATSRPSENHTKNEGSVSRSSTGLTGPIEKADEEYDKMMHSITTSMSSGHYEDAVIQWLQTQREQEFFVNYFSKFNPDFLRDLSPLLLLSLGATLSVDFEDELLRQRVSWMEVIVVAFQANVTAGTCDDQVRSLIPKIVGIYIQRLEHLFMRVSQIAAQDPLLKRLSLLVAASNRILETSRALENMGGMSGMSNVQHGL